MIGLLMTFITILFAVQTLVTEIPKFLDSGKDYVTKKHRKNQQRKSKK